LVGGWGGVGGGCESGGGEGVRCFVGGVLGFVWGVFWGLEGGIGGGLWLVWVWGGGVV